MSTKTIREKLISDFGKILEDDSKISLLEGFFDAINKENEKSNVSESHYLKVEEAREKYLDNKKNVISWDTFEKQLRLKYDL